LEMYRRDARRAAEMSLEKMRLDPLDTGALDQRLFNGWWGWRMRGEPWVFRHDEMELRLSDRREEFDGAQRSWFEEQGGVDEGDMVAPEPLRRMLGLTRAKPEPARLDAVCDRLGRPDKPGARWKATVPAGPPPARDRPAVTHLVVDGIARAYAGVPAGAEVGSRVRLEDGVEALAVHVPEV